MEYLIESTIISCDLDNLQNCLCLLESNNDNVNGVIKKITEKIKEMWEKIKRFFLNKKTEENIKTLESESDNIKLYEKLLEKENPEKLSNQKEKMSKKLIFEGIHIKDWADAFKRFFQYNLDCFKKHQCDKCKGLREFLNKKQKTIRKVTLSTALMTQVLVNVYFQFRGITVQSDLLKAADELDKRVHDKLEHAAFQAGLSYRKNQLIFANHQGVREGMKELNIKGEDRKTAKAIEKEIDEKIKSKYKAASEVNDSILKGKSSNYTDEKTASLILKNGIAQFNTISSLIASGITLAINFVKYGKNSDKRILTAQSEGSNSINKIILDRGARGRSDGAAMGMAFNNGLTTKLYDEKL